MKAILSSLTPARRRAPAAAIVAAAGCAAIVALGAPVWLGLAAGAFAGAALAAALGTLREPVPPPSAAPVAGTATEAGPPGSASPLAAARRLVDAMPTPLLVIGESGLILQTNPATRAILPRIPPSAHHASVIRAPEFVEAVARSFADGEARTVTFEASPGRERIFDARLAPLAPSVLSERGKVLLVQIEDRTDAYRTERLRSDFVANASHELRTPLASIIGFIETLQNHARDDPAARERFLAIMARQAARMQRLVDDLLSLSRIEMSQHVRPRDICSVHDIAAEAASALLPVAEAAGATLKIDVSPGEPAVQGDRDQLYQVFSNLIDNAIKYGGSGATVTVAAAPPSRAFPGRVGIAVRDTGPGIAREHLPRLTERFYRANVGNSRHKGGTGLGLAIVKHILHRHEAKLEIVSTPGEGSTFTVWLPRAMEGEPLRLSADAAAP